MVMGDLLPFKKTCYKGLAEFVGLGGNSRLPFFLQRDNFGQNLPTLGVQFPIAEFVDGDFALSKERLPLGLWRSQECAGEEKNLPSWQEVDPPRFAPVAALIRVRSSFLSVERAPLYSALHFRAYRPS